MLSLRAQSTQVAHSRHSSLPSFILQIILSTNYMLGFWHQGAVVNKTDEGHCSK